MPWAVELPAFQASDLAFEAVLELDAGDLTAKEPKDPEGFLILGFIAVSVSPPSRSFALLCG